MPTYVITETQGKLAPMWQDTSPNESSTIFSWNINQERQTEQMPSPNDQTTKAQTQIMKKFLYGQMNTSVSTTYQSESLTLTVSMTIGTPKSSKHSINNNWTSRNGYQRIISPYWMEPTGITELPWLSWQTMRLGGG